MGKEIEQKELSREELENFYVMVRAYYPNAVRGVELGVTGFAWLYGYDERELSEGSAMIMGTDTGPLYYVGESAGGRTVRRCRTRSRRRFMNALQLLSDEADLSRVIGG